MLHQPTVEKLHNMRLSGMVTAWEAIQADADARQMSFEEKLALMVDRQYTQRQNEALTRRLRYAKLKGNAAVENIDYRAARGLDKSVVRSLAQDSAWVGKHENIFITGPTGVGKSYIESHPSEPCVNGKRGSTSKPARSTRSSVPARWSMSNTSCNCCNSLTENGTRHCVSPAHSTRSLSCRIET